MHSRGWGQISEIEVFDYTRRFEALYAARIVCFDIGCLLAPSFGQYDSDEEDSCMDQGGKALLCRANAFQTWSSNVAYRGGGYCLSLGRRKSASAGRRNYRLWTRRWHGQRQRPSYSFLDLISGVFEETRSPGSSSLRMAWQGDDCLPKSPLVASEAAADRARHKAAGWL
jgi:hypothetical protein